jgi:L-arabinose isomerase
MGELPGPDAEAHHAAFASHVARRLAPVADVIFTRPARNPDEIDAVSLELQELDVDALVLLMLGDAPIPPSLRALAQIRLPLLLANVQPERAVIDDWNGDDLVFNRGVRAAQALAGACARSGISLSVITGDWMSDGFGRGFADWAAAAHAARELGHAPPDDGAAMLALAASSMFGGAELCQALAMDWNLDGLVVEASPTFTWVSGPATTAALARLDDATTRLVVGSGEIVAGPELPRLAINHFCFRPDAGLDAFMDAWLALGAAPPFVTTPGDQRERWLRLAELLDIEYEET